MGLFFHRFLTSIVALILLVIGSSSVYAATFLSLEETVADSSVKLFEKNLSDISRQQRWTSYVDIYTKKGAVKESGRYTYDSGSVRRVFSDTKTDVSFIMLSNGEVSCERTTSPKFPDTLQADLKAEWLCSKSGNPETVRLIYSFRPVGLVTTLAAASGSEVKFNISLKEKNKKSVLTILPSNAKNIKTSKIVFTALNNSLKVDIFNKKYKSTQYYISPSSDTDFVTNINDVKKTWK